LIDLADASIVLLNFDHFSSHHSFEWFESCPVGIAAQRLALLAGGRDKITPF
jgi:hypothetical protein